MGEFVLGLIHNPETLREQGEAEAARERTTLRDQRKYISALASRLNEADSERDRLVRLYARGGLSDDEYDSYTAEIDELPRIREHTISDEHKAQVERDRHNEDGPKPYPVLPGTYRKRTPEELDRLRLKAERERDERYRWAYEKLGLKAMAYPDGTLEISWRGGVSKLLGRSLDGCPRELGRGGRHKAPDGNGPGSRQDRPQGGRRRDG